MSVTRMLLPRKVYLLTHQAALTPNTKFNGTEMATAISVSFSADRASGSKIASKKVPRPIFRPWETTITNGNSRNSTKINQPRPIRIRREAALPRRAALAEALAPIEDADMEVVSFKGFRCAAAAS
ncbi:hypothetical protein D3C80_1437400 [compost metagenome]